VAIGTFGTAALQGLGLGVDVLAQTPGLLFFLSTFSLLMVGIILTTKSPSIERRALGLGMIIGWALAPIVFAGACVLYAVTFHPRLVG